MARSDISRLLRILGPRLKFCRSWGSGILSGRAFSPNFHHISTLAYFHVHGNKPTNLSINNSCKLGCQLICVTITF